MDTKVKRQRISNFLHPQGINNSYEHLLVPQQSKETATSRRSSQALRPEEPQTYRRGQLARKGAADLFIHDQTCLLGHGIEDRNLHDVLI